MSTVAEIESRIGEVKSAWQAKDAENDAIVASAPIENGVLMIDAGRRDQFTRNQNDMLQMKSLMEDLTKQKELKSWAGQPVGGPSGMQAEAMHRAEQMMNEAQEQAESKGSQFKTMGQLFTSSEEFKALQRSGGAKMDAPFVFRGKDIGSKWEAKGLQNANVEQKDVYSSSPAGGPPLGFRPLYREDIVVQAFRKVRVRDLFPVQSTTAAIIEYFRVVGFVQSNAASTVPERLADNSNFGIAPHTLLNFQGTQSPVRMIAHWEAAHRNVLNDVPQLQGVIDTELLYGLRLAEDNQILNGTGTGEDLLGLMNTPYVQQYLALQGGTSANRSSTGAGQVGLPGDTKADDIRRAATKAILAYYEPTGVIMHPSDWESIELTKDTTGAYIIAIAVALGAEQRIWRLPVVDTPAMAQGKALVGSFGLGAKLYDREEGTIRVAEQHMDFFLRQAIVVLAEERLALTVPRPESFVATTLGA